ncbi:GlxA family transcriptional regulator [Vibrio gallicus]|uniref:GlxA family transcriptional regulator n=1 Tax=Vibrio gallicus TaxID=190897 RepID=UPI0021C3D651|nr:helix-turn-helix domain-containing protein [Vibrio gallicus]
MTIRQQRVALLAYPSVSKSAVYGLCELFEVANRVLAQRAIGIKFSISIVECIDDCIESQLIIIPPSIDQDRAYLRVDEWIIEWIKGSHAKGCVLTSACAGAFILARCGVIGGRSITTHWALAELFTQHFPDIPVHADKILISHGDIVTSAGVMAWVDLGLEIISRFCSPSVMRQVGKILVVDTGSRQQSYYAQFSPSETHGDASIIKAQHWIHTHYSKPLSVTNIAQQCHLTTRTLLRRFHKATGYKPLQYVQRYRIQMACEQLECSNLSFESIARKVGYEDVGACRNQFQKIVGLTPKMFRQRFVRDS